MPRSANDISDAEIRLLITPGVGVATRRKLLNAFGNAEAVSGATLRDLASVDGIARNTAESLRRAMDEADIDQQRHAMHDSDASIILHGDADYPALLAQIDDAPPALWIRGSLTDADRLCVALVGSRRCSAYGREQAGRFASLLAQSGLTIVSGGAAGVDGEAHRGALRVNGRTIVVQGCGLSRCYPPQHKELFERIVKEQRGAILSEYPMHTQPRPQNFPRRNRIISGLSLGVLVVEAAKRSGALITARLAAEEHNREVMAVPGRVDSPASAGCLEILRQQTAALVRDHADVLHQLDASNQLVRGAVEAAGRDAGGASSATLFDGNLTDEQRAIVDVLAEAGQMLVIDQIAARTQLPHSRIMAELTLLQIRGSVGRNADGVHLKEAAAR